MSFMDRLTGMGFFRNICFGDRQRVLGTNDHRLVFSGVLSTTEKGIAIFVALL